MQIHESGENYLKAIFILKQKQGVVRSVAVAEYLNVSKSSVSHAVAILRDGGMLIKDGDKPLHLTDVGQKVAGRIYERHKFFTELLENAGVDNNTAHKNACRLEHAVSKESFKRIRDAYRDQQRDNYFARAKTDKKTGGFRDCPVRRLFTYP